MTYIEQIEKIISDEIVEIGHPVGMGIAPHPERLRRMAEKIAALSPEG